MNFLLPWALLGLLTLPAILLLHMLRNRRQQLPISSLQLWRGLQQRKHGTLPRNIPLTFMLLLQIVVAMALTLALARPAFSFLLREPRQAIFILDTTTSMLAQADDIVPGAQGSRSRFDLARQAVRSYLEGLEETDSFALISLDPDPQILATGEADRKPQALAVLDNLVPGATGLNLPAALTLANGLVEANRQNQVIVLTDGDTSVDRQSLPVMLAPVTWQIMPAGSGQGEQTANQALLNVSSQTLPDGRYRLFARIVNYSQAQVVRTLRVTVDARLFSETTVRLEAEEEAARVWTLPAQAETAAVEIVEPDGLLLDNRAEVLLLNASQQRVLLVSDTPEILARALAAQPGLDLTVESLAGLFDHPAVDLDQRAADFDLLVFEGLPFELTAWPGGNIWVVNPPLGHTLLPAPNYVRRLRPDPATASALLAGIDLSGVYFNRAPQLSLPEWAKVDLMALPLAGNSDASLIETTTRQEYPLIFHGTVGNSRLVVWAFDLAESNLPARLALPLLTASTISTLVSPSPPRVVPIGEPVPMSSNFSIETPAGRRLFLGDNIFTRTRQPGIYRIYNENNTLVAGFAVQAGSALESNLTALLRPDALAVPVAPRLAELSSRLKYHEYWPWFVGLALLMVTVEGWLAWRR